VNILNRRFPGELSITLDDAQPLGGIVGRENPVPELRRLRSETVAKG
jgi:hypothetical protein